MPSCNIIVDSCSYFRLAQSIHPLLKIPFGRQKYCLGVIDELDKEYAKSPTLKNKFFWVNQPEYAGNRKDCFSPSLKQRSEINHAFFFIREFVRDCHMLDSGFLKMKQVRSIASYWAYQNDKPRSFRKDFKRIFSEDPPK
jgi:hypothetical protein